MEKTLEQKTEKSFGARLNISDCIVFGKHLRHLPDILINADDSA